jgi:hypothetical protein
MAKYLGILVAFMLSTSAFAEQEKSADHAAIEAVVMDYFDGQGEASAERLNRAFARDVVSMVAATKNDQGVVELRAFKDMGPVLDRWAANESPPGAGRDHEILDMHIQDGRLATVVFRYADRFYDALTLIKIDGEWKIVAKAFVEQ